MKKNHAIILALGLVFSSLISQVTNAQNVVISNSPPVLTFINPSSGADLKHWDFYTNGSLLLGRTVNDVNNAANVWLAVNRSGFVPTTVSFPLGNIGIGTTTPTKPLDLKGEMRILSGSTSNGSRLGSDNLGFFISNDDAATDAFRLYGGSGNSQLFTISSLGNVGIGTSSPNVKLDVQGDFGKYDQGRLQGLRIGNTSVYGASGAMTLSLVNKVSAARDGIGGNAEKYLIRSDGFDTYLAEGAGNLIYGGTGSVAIGTIDPKGYKLAVNGNAVATSMTVKLNGNWPDYVFKPSYTLPSLSDVKKYIDRYQRLPEMPSDKDVEKNGIELGEMIKIQTKKIEELTLYLIEKDKQVEQQSKQLKDQQKQLDEIKAQMAKLIK